MTWPAVLVVAGVWLTLAYLVVFDAAIARWRRERSELERCGGVIRPLTNVRRDPRRDPSPTPRHRTGDDAA